LALKHCQQAKTLTRHISSPFAEAANFDAECFPAEVALIYDAIHATNRRHLVNDGSDNNNYDSSPGQDSICQEQCEEWNQGYCFVFFCPAPPEEEPTAAVIDSEGEGADDLVDDDLYVDDVLFATDDINSNNNNGKNGDSSSSSSSSGSSTSDRLVEIELKNCVSEFVAVNNAINAVLPYLSERCGQVLAGGRAGTCYDVEWRRRRRG
jgi:hypothetical protein